MNIKMFLDWLTMQSNGLQAHDLLPLSPTVKHSHSISH